MNASTSSSKPTVAVAGHRLTNHAEVGCERTSSSAQARRRASPFRTRHAPSDARPPARRERSPAAPVARSQRFPTSMKRTSRRRTRPNLRHRHRERARAARPARSSIALPSRTVARAATARRPGQPGRASPTVTCRRGAPTTGAMASMPSPWITKYEMPHRSRRRLQLLADLVDRAEPCVRHLQHLVGRDAERTGEALGHARARRR